MGILIGFIAAVAISFFWALYVEGPMRIIKHNYRMKVFSKR